MSVEAYSLDNDGVISRRQLPIQFATLRRLARYGPAIYEPPLGTPPRLERICTNSKLSLPESLSCWIHSHRKLFPEVVPTLSASENRHFFLNTGRPHQIDWYLMTLESLGEAKKYFRGRYFFRPQKTKTMLSKLAAVAELMTDYGDVTHVDDNPADALPIAAKFPRTQVVLIRDWSTKLLLHNVDLAKHPNVKLVSDFSQIFIA